MGTPYWSGVKFLTNAPYIRPIRTGETYCLSILTGAVGTARFRAVIKVVYPVPSPSTLKERYYFSDFVTPVKNMIQFTVKIPAGETSFDYLEVYVSDDLSQSSGTERRVYVPDFSAKKNKIRFAWLNPLGGIDHYTFTGSKASQVDVDKRDLFEKARAYPFSSTDIKTGILKVDGTKNLFAFSDFENTETYEWLSEIITSPYVWVVEDGDYIPVVITNKSMQVENEELVQLKLEYRKSIQRSVQHA